MSLCSSCGRELPPGNDFVKCTVSDCELHYACSGISAKTWRQMGNSRRETYSCVLCRGIKKDTGSNSSLAEENVSTCNILPDHFLENLEKKIEAVVQNAIEKKIQSFSAKIVEFERSLEYCSNKFDDFFEKINIVSKRMDELEKENSALKKNNCKLTDELSALRIQFEEFEQYSRNRNLQVDGVPELPGENIYEIVNKLAIAVDETIVINQDIQAAHRLPTKNSSKPRPIVVQFTNRQKRDIVLKKAKGAHLKTTSFVRLVPDTNVYVNEHLTPHYKKLFYEAKLVKTRLQFQYLWIANSKILMRKDKDSNAVRISSLADLEKLARDPSSNSTSDRKP